MKQARYSKPPTIGKRQQTKSNKQQITDNIQHTTSNIQHKIDSRQQAQNGWQQTDYRLEQIHCLSGFLQTFHQLIGFRQTFCLFEGLQLIKFPLSSAAHIVPSACYQVRNSLPSSCQYNCNILILCGASWHRCQNFQEGMVSVRVDRLYLCALFYCTMHIMHA